MPGPRDSEEQARPTWLARVSEWFAMLDKVLDFKALGKACMAVWSGRRRIPAAENPKESTAGMKCTEFKVWSSLLSQWSPVFKQMITSEAFTESRQSRLVIKDFSPVAVETFLRFLHSGKIEGELNVLVEVAALAGKHQADKLPPLCRRALLSGLKPSNACDVFAEANYFQQRLMRGDALAQILMHPPEALKERPSLDQELLEKNPEFQVASHRESGFVEDSQGLAQSAIRCRG